MRVAESLWRLWQDLPRHPVLFEVLEPGVLRYAAIDWTQPRIALGVRPADDLRVAAWGIELAQTMELGCRACRPRRRRGSRRRS